MDSDMRLTPSDPPVEAILERAERLTPEEACALAVAVRGRPDLRALAQSVLIDHQRFLNGWAMFDHWPHPADEMIEARKRVAAALGERDTPGHSPWIDADDGSVLWGAATAVAYAVLGSGRASLDRRLLAPWQSVVG